MRRFLTALTVFSILVMSQNVLAITPAPVAEGSALAVAKGPSEAGMYRTAGASDSPTPFTLALLVVGLSGLAAAGDPRVRRKKQFAEA